MAGPTIDVLRDITLYIGVIACVFVQFVCVRTLRWRDAPWRPGKRVFVTVWIILYALISATWLIVLYTGDDTAHAPAYYIAFYALLLTHLLLNKAWTWIVSLVKYDVLAFVVALLMLATAVAMLVMLALVQSWVAFGLMIPNALWVAVAVYLNGRYTFSLRQSMIVPRKQPQRQR